jgi:hypothetical protein
VLQQKHEGTVPTTELQHSTKVLKYMKGLGLSSITWTTAHESAILITELQQKIWHLGVALLYAECQLTAAAACGMPVMEAGFTDHPKIT